jgi:hypothetical protein
VVPEVLRNHARSPLAKIKVEDTVKGKPGAVF